MLHIEPFQIKIWFQNRSTKWKNGENISNAEAAMIMKKRLGGNKMLKNQQVKPTKFSLIHIFFYNLQALNTNVMENLSTQFIENIQSSEKDSTVGCNIGLKTSSLENTFPVQIILSSLPSDEDDDKLLIVDEELSDSNEELMKKNTSEY